jgi:hypothetical protein
MFGKRKFEQLPAKALTLASVPESHLDDCGSSASAHSHSGDIAAARAPDLSQPGFAASVRPRPGIGEHVVGDASCSASREVVETSKIRVQPLVMQRIDVGKASALLRPEFQAQLADIVAEILVEEKLQLN